MASTALQALERMMLSKERRDQFEVSKSLQMMQLAQSASYQQKQLQLAEQKQNISIMQSSLEMLNKQNEMMRIDSANKFLSDSGLYGIYSKFKDDDSNAMTNAVKFLTGSKGYFSFGSKKGIDKDIATQLVSATWAAVEHDKPKGIIDIASRLHYMDEVDSFQNPSDKKLYDAFVGMGILTSDNRTSMLNQFKTMRKSIDNQMNLNKEIVEFAKGNYTIDREFDMINESLKKVELEKIKKGDPPKPTKFESILPPDKIIQKFESESEKLQSEKNDILQSIDQLEDIEKNANFYKQMNMDIPEDDLLAIQNKDAVLSEYQSNLEEVDKKILELANITKEGKRLMNIRKIEEMPDTSIAP